MAIDAPGQGLPFLEPEPPPLVARSLSILLLLLFAVAMLAMVLVHVPETVEAPFTLVPMQAADPVKTPHAGIVVEVHAAEAQLVKKGDVLYAVASEAIADRASERDTLDATLRGGTDGLSNARRTYEALRAADEKERGRLERRIEDLARQQALRAERLTLARQDLQRRQEAFDQGLVSALDLSKPKMDVNQVTLELEQLAAEMSDARGAITKLTADMAARRAAFDEAEHRLQNELERATIRRDMLGRERVTGGNVLAVPAPCDGTVAVVRTNNPGAVVHEGDVLAEVACAGTTFEAELRLPQRGLAQLRPGQTARLMYDAFPYQRYGLRYGTVTWVSPTSTPGADGTFRVRAALDPSSATTPRPLAAGMSGRATIVVGRRRLVSYALEPLRQMRENLASAR